MDLYFRWRFEALKSRCTIINRELLLEDHKIAFEPLNKLEARQAVQKHFPDVAKETPQIFDAIDQQQTAPEHPPVEAKVIDENSSNATAVVNEPPLTVSSCTNDDAYTKGNRTNEITQSSNLEKKSTSNDSIMENIANRFGQCHIVNTPKVSTDSNTPQLPKYDKTNIETLATELIEGQENQQNTEHLSKVTGIQDAPTEDNTNATLFVPQYRPIQMTPSRRELIRNIRDSTISPPKKPSRRPLQFSTVTNENNESIANEKKEKIMAPKSSFKIKHVHLTKDDNRVVVNFGPLQANNHNQTKN